jgi:hypothetical protein
MVSRNEITITEKAGEALAWLIRRANAIRQEFVHENENSAYHTLNARLVGGAKLPDGQLRWAEIENSEASGSARWQAVSFPVLNGPRLRAGKEQKFLWNGKQVKVSSRLEQIDRDSSTNYLTWNPPDVPPERILIADATDSAGYAAFGLYWLWTRMPERREAAHPAGSTCEFPENWQSLCGVNLDEYSTFLDDKTIWNPGNKVVGAVDMEGWEWVRGALGNTLDPISLKDELFKSSGRLSAWIIRCLNEGKKQLWNGLRERDALFLTQVWEALDMLTPGQGGQAPGEIYFLNAKTFLAMTVLTPGGWKVTHQPREILARLSDPGPEWRLVLEDSSAESSGPGRRKSKRSEAVKAKGGAPSNKGKPKASPPVKARAGAGRGAKNGAGKKKR